MSSSTTSARSRRYFAAVTVSLAAITILGACTGGDAKDKEDDAPVTTTSLVIPKECDGIDLPRSEDGAAVPAMSQAVPQACRNAVFNEVVNGTGSSELKAIDPDVRLGHAVGVCSFSRSIAESPGNAPSYSGFLKSTAGSWEVSEAVVDEVVTFSGNVCPDELAPLLNLRTETVSTVVNISAGGAGKLTLTYTGPNGDEMSAEAESPWEHEVRLPDNTDFRVHVVAEDGRAECVVTTPSRDELAVDRPEDSKEATCTVTAERIRTAGL